MGAIDRGDENSAGIFVDRIMYQVGELRHLGAAHILVSDVGEMRIDFDWF